MRITPAPLALFSVVTLLFPVATNHMISPNGKNLNEYKRTYPFWHVLEQYLALQQPLQIIIGWKGSTQEQTQNT